MTSSKSPKGFELYPTDETFSTNLGYIFLWNTGKKATEFRGMFMEIGNLIRSNCIVAHTTKTKASKDHPGFTISIKPQALALEIAKTQNKDKIEEVIVWFKQQPWCKEMPEDAGQESDGTGAKGRPPTNTLSMDTSSLSVVIQNPRAVDGGSPDAVIETKSSTETASVASEHAEIQARINKANASRIGAELRAAEAMARLAEAEAVRLEKQAIRFESTLSGEQDPCKVSSPLLLWTPSPPPLRLQSVAGSGDDTNPVYHSKIFVPPKQNTDLVETPLNEEPKTLGKRRRDDEEDEEANGTRKKGTATVDSPKMDAGKSPTTEEAPKEQTKTEEEPTAPSFVQSVAQRILDATEPLADQAKQLFAAIGWDIKL